ncbi:hypothetical protein FRC07_007622 [Ceratobasidium sp. 392]|nr:hypothetical protein FRC07_007622 [Ceratobasidium sp. 392]
MASDDQKHVHVRGRGASERDRCLGWIDKWTPEAVLPTKNGTTHPPQLMLPALARRLARCRRTRVSLGPLVSVEALASAEAQPSHPRPFNAWAHRGLSDGDDEAARSAILENALKGRQPSDLMLRCTVLDQEGARRSPD